MTVEDTEFLDRHFVRKFQNAWIIFRREEGYGITQWSSSNAICVDTLEQIPEVLKEDKDD